ncbi:hypothetical protein H0H92_014120 [Tricholoma furcatifolium]|nr:hypothetical protein H0H92_014120 [Tricholoma furcatifolium]
MPLALDTSLHTARISRNYVDAATAKSENLTFASENHFILRADYKKVLKASGPGRDSGEIDILEGVNDQGPNQATLHTGSGCTMPSTRDESGTPVQNNCYAKANNNAGCGVKFSDAQSYGPTFNENGGGWFAMERTTTYIKVWFWSRTATDVPSDVSNGDNSVDTGNWGTPAAYFPDTSCAMGNKFGPQNIIINLAFCGTYAGNAAIYKKSGYYVDNNPSAFVNAYFDLEWLNIYE